MRKKWPNISSSNYHSFYSKNKLTNWLKICRKNWNLENSSFANLRVRRGGVPQHVLNTASYTRFLGSLITNLYFICNFFFCNLTKMNDQFITYNICKRYNVVLTNLHINSLHFNRRIFIRSVMVGLTSPIATHTLK